MSKVNFKVTVDGKEYDCYTIREGKRVFTQTIYVEGYGFEADEKQYGNGRQYRDLYLMQYEALIIAKRIIRSKTE